MVGRIVNGDVSPVFLDALLLGLMLVLPVLLLAYRRQFLLTRRLRPEFSLRKSEAAELDRALILYRRVRSRLSQLNGRSRKTAGVWQVILPLTAPVDQDETDEREDLEAHTRHLRTTILRLRRLPLQRLRATVRAFSLRAALGRALAAYGVIFVLLLLALHASEAVAVAQAASAPSRISLIWPPFYQGFQANAAAACLTFVLIPGFYFFRRAALRRDFGLEFCVLKELAAMQPDQDLDRCALGSDAWGTGSGSARDSSECWFSVLGVSPSASIDQVREAYKTLIKGSHPDRVQDLSPAIRSFAEAETKKLNAAYKEALATLA